MQRPSDDLFVVIFIDLFVRRFTAVEVRFAPRDHRIPAEEEINSSEFLCVLDRASL